MKKQKGMTLLELLVATTVLAILLSVTVPALGDWTKKIRMDTAVYTLQRSIQFARSEAVSRNEIVSICPSLDAETCTQAENWGIGWIIYADQSGSRDREQNDPILRVQEQLSGTKINYNRGKRISVNGMGRISQNGSVWVCSEQNQGEATRLIMIHSGRVRTETAHKQCV